MSTIFILNTGGKWYDNQAFTGQSRFKDDRSRGNNKEWDYPYALYLWLVLDKPAPYFDIMMYSFKYLFFTLPIPYAILALSIKVYDSNISSETAAEGQKRMRFYDVSHNLKFVITAGSILYIGADVNYVNIYYLDNGKVKCYVLRNSMRSIDEVCLSNGLVRRFVT